MIKELLKEGLSELGLIPAEEQINAFMIYLSELKKWNKTYNLTGIKKDEDIVIKHFLDSLLYLKAMPTGELRVADVGIGAGFPGIPAKFIRPEIHMYLIEPTGKKCLFLRNIIRQLDLKKTEVIEKRIEEVKEDVIVTKKGKPVVLMQFITPPRPRSSAADRTRSGAPSPARARRSRVSKWNA